MEKEGNGNLRNSIAAGYRRALFKDVTEEKLDALEKLYHQAFANFEKRSGEVEKFMGKDYMNTDRAKLLSTASFTLVANALLNLDEFLTKS